MVRFLLIRHGESKDNLKNVWAGWKDSPLSNHGMKQAGVLAAYFQEDYFAAIHSSDLRRAQMTARAIQEKSNTKLSPQSSSLLREQYFGSGEGMKFAKKDPQMSLAAHFAKGLFPAVHTRSEHFPGGESLNDVANRANDVIDQILLPYVLKEVQDNQSGLVVAIISHGIFIAELVAALMKRSHEYDGRTIDLKNFRGMKNTAWTKVEVCLKLGDQEASDVASFPPSAPLFVKVGGINQHSHLSSLHRQKGGIANLTYDPRQKDIRTFFGGKASGGKANGASSRKPY